MLVLNSIDSNQLKNNKWNAFLKKNVMPLAHYYDVDRELHELQHRGELVPTRNEIMGKIGASMLLSYSGLVVSYVTREGLGFVRVLHSRVVVGIRGNPKDVDFFVMQEESR